MPVNFDECFATFPKLNPPQDLEEFWKNSIRELKNIPIKNQSKAQLKSSIIRETYYDIHFQSVQNYQIDGYLIIPRKRGDLPAVIFLHDYMGEKRQPVKGLTENGICQLHIDLRGHGAQLIRPELTIENQTEERIRKIKDWTPEYFLKGLDRKEEFYVGQCYLDILRSIDFLRLTEGVDGDRIIVCGKSFGGSMALFSAAYSERVKGIVCETPNFAYIEEDQMACDNPWVREITQYVSQNRTKKSLIKKNLNYFDAIHFCDKVKVPALFSCGMDDRVSHPKSIFATFNHLNCDKRMQLYPMDGNNAGIKDNRQNNANLEFFKEVFGLNDR